MHAAAVLQMVRLASLPEALHMPEDSHQPASPIPAAVRPSSPPVGEQHHSRKELTTGLGRMHRFCPL